MVTDQQFLRKLNLERDHLSGGIKESARPLNIEHPISINVSPRSPLLFDPPKNQSVRLPSQNDVMARTVTNRSGTKLADLQLVKKSSVSSFKEGGESHKNLRKPLQIIAELEQMTQATL